MKKDVKNKEIEGYLAIKEASLKAMNLTHLTQQEGENIFGGKMEHFEREQTLTWVEKLSTTLIFLLSFYKLVNLYQSRYLLRPLSFPEGFEKASFFKRLQNMYVQEERIVQLTPGGAAYDEKLKELVYHPWHYQAYTTIAILSLPAIVHDLQQGSKSKLA